MIAPLILSMIRKKKTALQPSPVPKGILSNILTVKLANDMLAHKFEPTKDILNPQHGNTTKNNAINKYVINLV